MAERHHICVFVDDIRRTPMAIGDATSSSAEDDQSQRFVRYLLLEAFHNDRCEEQRRVMRPCSTWMLGRPLTSDRIHLAEMSATCQMGREEFKRT
jgi:hypothetical protein